MDPPLKMIIDFCKKSLFIKPTNEKSIMLIPFTRKYILFLRSLEHVIFDAEKSRFAILSYIGELAKPAEAFESTTFIFPVKWMFEKQSIVLVAIGKL